MKDLLSPESRTHILKLLFTGAVYLAVTYGSLVYLVPSGGSGASLVWPVSAVGAGALFLFGYELWPALMLPFFVLLLARGISPPLAATVALGNTIESLLVAYLLKYLSFRPFFAKLRDTLSFIVAAVSATLASSLIITLGTYLFGVSPLSFDTVLWRSLWVGHAVSLLVFGPFVFYWAGRPVFYKSRREIFESLCMIAAVAAFSIVPAWTQFSSVGGVPLLYVLILALIWASLRTGPRGISLALAVMGLAFSTGILFGYAGLSHTQSVALELFNVQVLVGVLAVIFLPFTSITEERKDAMKVLEAHVGQLETALHKIQTEDQAKADFIAILAHELRNPLSPLLSGLELLKESGQGPEDILQMMGAHMYTLARLLDDLLDITRISQKKFKLQKETVELRSVIGQSLEMAAPSLKLRGHTLLTDLTEEELWLSADSVRLAQIFVNLLNNAGKYTDPGGMVTLTVMRDGGTARVTVKDNGIGIAPDKIGRVFEAFGGEDGPERRPGGLRIGLSLAQRMAQMHHGSIEAKSAGLGRGSEFTVSLPLLPTAPLPLSSDARPFEQPRSRFSNARGELAERQKQQRLTILVVDDNEAAAQTLAKLLERQGHKAVIAYDAYEALEKIKIETPQAALLDIGLPGMNGYELAKRLRNTLDGSVALVALTGYGQEEDKQKAAEAGFDEHLVKPVSIVDIERVLARLRN